MTRPHQRHRFPEQLRRCRCLRTDTIAITEILATSCDLAVDLPLRRS
jgi:hypothetical protein